jgi:hypothetical protein
LSVFSLNIVHILASAFVIAGMVVSGAANAFQVLGNAAYQHRDQRTPNTVELIDGDTVSLGVSIALDPGETLDQIQAVATQGGSLVPLECNVYGFSGIDCLVNFIFGTLPTGSWTVTVTNTVSGAQRLVPSIDITNAGVMPFVQNVRIGGDPLAPTLTWDLPMAFPPGVTANRIRVRLFDETRPFPKDVITFVASNTGQPLATTFTVPGGHLSEGGAFAFRILLEQRVVQMVTDPETGGTITIGGNLARSSVFVRYTPRAGVPLLPYDDFTSATIDSTKWSGHEFVRRVNGGVFESALRRVGSSGSNTLTFVNEDAVTAIQADVTVTEVNNNGAAARARVVGDFYSDGTAGGGYTGDVIAGTEILHNGSSLVISFFAVRCNDINCATFTQLVFDDTTFGAAALGETHTLSVAWDGVSQLFTFGVDGVTTTFDPTAAAPVAGPAGPSRFKGLGTRVSGIDTADEGAFIAATFDNVIMNGNPYDDFSGAAIDAAKWETLEFVRRIEGGELMSTLRRRESNGTNALTFVNEDAVTAIQADVRVTSLINAGARRVRARLVGIFYNDGTAGGFGVGDIAAAIEIRHNGTVLVVALQVFRCLNASCTVSNGIFFDDTTFGPPTLGTTHTLLLAWDGVGVFTYGFDGATTTFVTTGIAPLVGPPQNPLKRIETSVVAPEANAEGSITAIFDNVMVKWSGDLDGDGDVDRADGNTLIGSFGSCRGDVSFVDLTDYNGSGCTDFEDYLAWYRLFKASAATLLSGGGPPRPPGTKKITWPQ